MEDQLRHAEEKLRLIQTISIGISEAEDFYGALKKTMENVCRATGWHFGEMWAPSHDESALEYILTWYDIKNGMERFNEYSKGFTFYPGIGLPGRVWISKKPEWVKDVSVNGAIYLRTKVALESGLRAALGVPIIAGDRVLAVMVFYMKEARDEDSRLGEIISTVAAQLGPVFQRKLAEDARHELQQRYEELVNNLNVGIYRHTLEGKFIEVNQAAVALAEAESREELLRHNVSELCKDRDVYGQTASRILKYGFIKNEEVECITLKGRRFWASITAVIKRDKKGNLFLDGIIEDVSEQRRLEEQLRHAQKMEAIGRLAGGIAHDFNNILTAIIGYAILLLVKKGHDELTRDYTENILTSCERATSLTRGLLTFSRKQSLNLQLMDLNEIIRRTTKILMRLIGEDIELKTDMTDRDLIVRADPSQIEQVLMNLATNSRDAMPDGGILTISTGMDEIDNEFMKLYGYGRPGSYGVISVSDTGVGMDRETQKRVFEPFFTTKEIGKGTGLGLSIIYGIIKQHNGYINVYSEPGKGTIFKIYLPLGKGLSEDRSFSELVFPMMGTETILLVEDEEDVRKISTTVLKEYGYKVIEAVDGEEGVKKFTENKDAVALLILDMVMPKMGGIEAYQLIRKIKPDVRALFTSGYIPDMEKVKGLFDQETDLIPKPISPTGLLKKVREALDRKPFP